MAIPCERVGLGIRTTGCGREVVITGPDDEFIAEVDRPCVAVAQVPTGWYAGH